jgi:peptidoglycan/LPS O-acetylase OafA/YrhL
LALRSPIFRPPIAIYDLKPEVPIKIGAESVALFFIISGFVILMTLDRSRKLVDFATSRFSRLYPVFWVSILITFSFVHLADLPGQQTTAWTALINATMAPSFFGHPAVDVVYWSLTVEICFYVIAGTIFALGLREQMLPLLCALMIAGTIEHYFPISGYPGGYRLRSILILDFWPLFIFGMTIYEMRARIRAIHVAIIVLCVLCSILVDWRQAIINSGLAAAVFCAAHFHIPGLTSRPVLYLGTISYSLYLVHANVGYCIMRAVLGTGWGQFSAGMAALCTTIALASALCFLIEKPSNIAVRRFLNEKLGREHSDQSDSAASTKPA